MSTIDGVTVPDSGLAREATEFVRDTTSSLLFNHSCRVYYFGALAGRRDGLRFDPELLYIGALFHDMGLTARYSSPADRFEVDGANAARDFLNSHGVDPRDIELVWLAVALHTTPGIPKYLHPVIALINAGVLVDAVGAGYEQFTETQRSFVTALYPRGADFEEEFIQAFYDWNKHKPETTYGTVTADVLAEKYPNFHRSDACARIRHSAWASKR